MQETRIYKYALKPTDVQTHCLDRANKLSRFLWNRLVKETKRAIFDIQNGRRASIENQYKKILAGKSAVGRRVEKLNKIAKDNNISLEDSLNLMLKSKIEKDTQIIVSKKTGQRLLSLSARKLAWRFALEKVNSQRHNLMPQDTKSIWSGLMAKWTDICNAWDKGTKDAPKFKKFGQPSSLQKQVINIIPGEFVDLSWAGSDALKSVEVIYHRDIPKECEVKQIAIIKNSVNQWFVCYFIRGEHSIFEKSFPVTNNVIGIDPGIKSAFTTSEGKIIQFNGLSKSKRLEKKLNKLQIKSDRQEKIILIVLI